MRIRVVQGRVTFMSSKILVTFGITTTKRMLTMAMPTTIMIAG